jgi:hypothetical protein
MIRYPTTEAALLSQIDAASPTWRSRAADRTKGILKAKRYDEPAGIWSEVKPVFMSLQRNKCAFCERRLEGLPYGRIEHDLEHFRPKSEVRVWPTDELRAARGIHYPFATGSANANGYYRLAYAPLNYAAACKPCNTTLKSSFFPVRGRRQTKASEPRACASERPLLIYPIGDVDDDPEALISFHGIRCQPVHPSGDSYWRALVTIEFFSLNVRDELLYQRAQQIVTLFRLDPVEDAGLRDALCKDSAPHSNCTRAFWNLMQADPQEAEAQFEIARAYIESQS